MVKSPVRYPLPTSAEQMPKASVAFLRRLILITVTAIVGAYWLSWHFGVRAPTVFSPFTVIFLAAVFFGSAFAIVGYVLWLAIQREPRPIDRLLALPIWTPAFLARRLLPSVLVFILLGAFGSFKSLIPYMHPFTWDAMFSDLDRLIFRTDPWRITHAFIGPRGTRLLDMVYGLWFPVWAFTLVYFACFADDASQRRFIMAFCAVWIVEGIVLATILSSAGPCYLEMIHNSYASRYAGLFPLAGAPGANAAQAMLAASYQGGDIGAFKGISAMPSVHVGTAFLLVLASRGWWRVAASTFCALIFVASVHLGWHYASDGIAASIVTYLCWRFARVSDVEVGAQEPLRTSMTPTPSA